MPLSWKTDWNERDNYAQDGVSDWARLWFNLVFLRDWLNQKYGFYIRFPAPALDGYKTVPLAGMLNALETALDAICVWPVPWIHDEVIWQAGETAPDCEDVNRWERNGKTMDEWAYSRARIVDLGWALGMAHTGLYGGL